MKRLAHALFVPFAAIEFLRFYLSRVLLGEERAFLGFTERLALGSGYYGVYLRAVAYRLALSSCSRDVHIGFGTVFSRRAATLGDHVYIGRHCSLGWVVIDRDVMIADLVAIPSGGNTHVVSGSSAIPPRHADNSFRPVHIGEGTWVGTKAVILGDVGRFCVIGAGAVVTTSIPDYSIAVGVPARVVGSTLTTGHEAAREAPPAHASRSRSTATRPN